MEHLWDGESTGDGERGHINRPHAVAKSRIEHGDVISVLNHRWSTLQGEWIGIGSDVSGWKLTKVDSNVVTISSGEQKIELKLYVDNQLNVLGSQQP